MINIKIIKFITITHNNCKCQSKYVKKIQNKNVHFIHLLFGKNLLVYKNFQLFQLHVNGVVISQLLHQRLMDRQIHHPTVRNLYLQLLLYYVFHNVYLLIGRTIQIPLWLWEDILIHLLLIIYNHKISLIFLLIYLLTELFLIFLSDVRI